MPINLARSAWQVAELVRREKVDLIHSNTVRAHIVGSLAALLARKPLIWTLHDNTFPRVALSAACARFPDELSSWRAGCTMLYAPLGGAKKFCVIPNGLAVETIPRSENSVRDELQIPVDAPLILGVGRLIESKGAHLLVDAAATLCQTLPHAHVVVVGGPDPDVAASVQYAKALASRVDTSPARAQIHLVGPRSDVHRFYAVADLFVYPATAPEGLPTVLLEAMARKLPVVASAVGGALEIVQDEVTGRLVAPDNKALLAQSHDCPDKHARKDAANGHFRLGTADSGISHNHHDPTLYPRVQRGTPSWRVSNPIH